MPTMPGAVRKSLPRISWFKGGSHDVLRFAAKVAKREAMLREEKRQKFLATLSAKNPQLPLGKRGLIGQPASTLIDTNVSIESLLPKKDAQP